MVFFIIECLGESPTIITGDTFAFSVSNRDERTRVERIPDQFMDLFGVVSFIHDIEVRMPESVTLSEEFFGMWDIMNRMLGDLQTGDYLSISIDRDRGFEETFSGLTGSPGIIER